jgi:hypothetical protein
LLRQNIWVEFDRDSGMAVSTQPNLMDQVGYV